MKKMLLIATLAATFAWWWQGEVTQAETQVLAAVEPTFEMFYTRADGESPNRTADLEALVRQAEHLVKKATERPCTVVMKYFRAEVSVPRSVMDISCGLWKKPQLRLSSEVATKVYMHQKKT